MYFTIQQISEKTGLSVHTLRYYEKEGLIIKIARNKSGHRSYNEEDIEWIRLIKILKVTGMPITVIKKFIKFFLTGDKTIPERKNILLIHKENILKKIEEYNNYLEKINLKINHYNDLEKNI